MDDDFVKLVIKQHQIINNILTDSQLDTRLDCGKTIREYYFLFDAFCKKKKKGKQIMRGYGLPRTKDVEGPDKADLRTYGLSRFAETRKMSARKRRAIRRIWKRKYRQSLKKKLSGISIRRYDRNI